MSSSIWRISSHSFGNSLIPCSSSSLFYSVFELIQFKYLKSDRTSDPLFLSILDVSIVESLVSCSHCFITINSKMSWSVPSCFKHSKEFSKEPTFLVCSVMSCVLTYHCISILRRVCSYVIGHYKGSLYLCSPVVFGSIFHSTLG